MPIPEQRTPAVTVIHHRHLVLLFSALLSLLAFQVGIVHSGVSSSSAPSPNVALDPSNAIQTQHSEYATSESGSSSSNSEHLGLPEEQIPTYDASAFDRSDEILQRSAEVLPDKLDRLGYPFATVSLFKDASSVSRYRAAIEAQVKENPTRKQFMPLFGMDGMRTYAMPIDDVSSVRWPKSAGRYAGKDGVTKAVVFSIYRPPQYPRLDAHIKPYGILRVKNAPDLHRPPEQARLLMHDLFETVRV